MAVVDKLVAWHVGSPLQRLDLKLLWVLAQKMVR